MYNIIKYLKLVEKMEISSNENNKTILLVKVNFHKN